MPTTSSSAAAVNDSRSFALGDEVEHRPHEEAADRDDADDGAEHEQRRLPRRARPARRVSVAGARDPATPSSGNTARIGMTRDVLEQQHGERWPARPCVLSRLALGEARQDDRGRRHREGRGRRERGRHSTPSSERSRPRSAARAADDLQRRRARRSAGAAARAALGRSSRPTRNSIITTPNSAKCIIVSTLSPTRAEHPRADHDAGDQVAENGAEPEALGDRHEHDGGAR